MNFATALAKRRYKAVTLDGGHVLLDGKPLLTPAVHVLALPTAALAEAVRAEWLAQGEVIRPDTMPMTVLANTAYDHKAAGHAARLVDELIPYAETDLLCYRAAEPPALAARQAAVWQPLLDWAALRFDAPLLVTHGVMPQRQPADSLKALRAALAEHDVWRLTALGQAVGAAGSLVLGLAILEGRLTASAAADAAELDEAFQNEQWGTDDEALITRAARRVDLLAVERFLGLLAAG